MTSEVKHFPFVALDNPTSSPLTQEGLGRMRRGPALIADSKWVTSSHRGAKKPNPTLAAVRKIQGVTTAEAARGLPCLSLIIRPRRVEHR